MKKLFWIVTVGIVATLVPSACSMDTDDEAEATVPYMGVCDRIEFADSADFDYAPLIAQLIMTEKVPLTGDASLFTEEAKTNDGYVQNAIVLCNEKAIKTYDAMLAQVTPAYMRSQLVATYGDSIQFDSLDAFTIHYSLYGMVVQSTTQVVATFKKEY